MRAAFSALANGLQSAEALIAPDLIFTEVANALRTKQLRGERAGIPPSLAEFGQYFDRIESCASQILRAVEIAVECKHWVCDYHDLALADYTPSPLLKTGLDRATPLYKIKLI